MIIQIFGTKKCKDTQKAIRYFKERRIEIQFIDLSLKGLSQGELNSVKNSIPLDLLIDKEGREYEKRNLKYIVHDIEQALLEYPLLFSTPIVRCGKKASLGHNPDIWAEWLKN
ncbi:MAG: ArsC/Spx/MgsR family protein [bacterium]